MIKSLIQVSPHLRPSCEKILNMNEVQKRVEKYFPDHDACSELDNSNDQLMNTIRVPKNLLYLTDRLPKPKYKQDMDKEEMLRRRTHEGGGMLPDLPNKKTTQIVKPKVIGKKKQGILPPCHMGSEAPPTEIIKDPLVTPSSNYDGGVL